MTIKDKNGKIYTLRGPNPLLNDQTEWDKNKVILHNFGNAEIQSAPAPIQENIVVVPPVKQEAKFIPAQTFIEEIKSEPKKLPVEEIKPEPKIDPVAKILKEKGIQYYCAPITGYKEHHDELYGSQYTTPIYGEQFIFPAIVIDQSDLQIQIWCQKELTDNSIIFQKIKEGVWEQRWWKIKETEPKSGGYLVIGVVSDINPSFD